MMRHPVDFDQVANLQVVALAGGVGGAKLVEGLAYLLPPSRLQIVVNTGDDFEHLGLTVCPDLDTVMYTLAGVANPKTGWGLEGETFDCMEAVVRLGGPSWFALGDKDLATHLVRTQKLRAGARLTEVTQQLARSLGVHHAILPMTDAPYRTKVMTTEGELPFQKYFVLRKWEPVIREIRWEGAGAAQPTPEVLAALEIADVVIICPSNPFVSIDPILSLPGVRERLAARPVIAVSPIIGGDAVKGPAAKMFRELGTEPSAVAVAAHYGDLLSGFVLDAVDTELQSSIAALGMAVRVAPTLMSGLEDRVRVAREVLAFAQSLASRT